MRTSLRIRDVILPALLTLSLAAVGLVEDRLEAQESAGFAGPADRPSDSAGSAGGRIGAMRPRPIPNFTVTVETDSDIYTVGETVGVRFRASDDCWVYIFNTDSDGVTRQVFPNYFDRDNAVRANRRYSIPIGRYWLVATGPPGTESLRIVAYRRAWQSLESWNEFSAGEPFPLRSVAPDEMRKRVGGEARAGQGDRSQAQQYGGGGLAIVPIPSNAYYYDYAEDATRFRVQSPRHYARPWDDPLPLLR
jgi:hypothetical protein